MAITAINTIKNWFKTGLIPTQEQFWAWLDSYRHKSEKIPVADIEGIDDLIAGKASTAVVNSHIDGSDAHQALFDLKENKNQKGVAGGYVPLNDFTKIAAQYLDSDLINSLPKGNYTGTDAQDLYNLIINATTGVTGKSIVPIDTPTGTGVASWIVVQNGTYTNFGGLVLPVNSVGVISRSATDDFTISYTDFDMSYLEPISVIDTSTSNPIDSRAVFDVLNGENIIPNSEFATNLDNWNCNYDGVISYHLDGKRRTLRANNFAHSDTGILNYFAISSGNTLYLEIIAKVEQKGDGKIKIVIPQNGEHILDLIDDGDYHSYYVEVDITYNENVVIIFTQISASNQIILFDSIKGFYKNKSIVGRLSAIESTYLETISVIDNAKLNPVDSRAISNLLGDTNIIVNSDFTTGYDSWQSNYGDTLTFVTSETRTGLRFKKSNHFDAGIVNYITIKDEVFYLEIIAKLEQKDDGKLRVQLGGVVKTIELIDDGDYHSYYVEFTPTASADALVIFNGLGVNTVEQIILFDSIKGYYKDGIISQVTKLSEALVEAVEDTVTYNLNSDINHIISYGQSLSMGASASAITTTVESDNMLTFSDDNWLALGSLVPFSFPVGFSEVPYGGTASALQELADKRGKDLSKSKFLFSYAGQGGVPISALAKGAGDPYNRFIQNVQNGYNRAQELGLTYSVCAVEWTQGEANMYNTSIQDYIAALVQLREDINTDVKAITKQTSDIPFVMYQPSSFNTVHTLPSDYNLPFVTLYEKMSQENEGFYLANPCYDKIFTVEGTTEDPTIIHLNALSYKRMGAEYGVIIDKLITGREHKRLTLTSVNFQGKLINLVFNKELVVDLVNVSSIANLGFTIDSNTIEYVTVNDNRVTLKCSLDITVGTLLKYAFNAYDNAGITSGPRGNIRSIDKYTFSFGTVYDWLPHKQISL